MVAIPAAFNEGAAIAAPCHTMLGAKTYSEAVAFMVVLIAALGKRILACGALPADCFLVGPANVFTIGGGLGSFGNPQGVSFAGLRLLPFAAYWPLQSSSAPLCMVGGENVMSPAFMVEAMSCLGKLVFEDLHGLLTPTEFWSTPKSHEAVTTDRI